MRKKICGLYPREKQQGYAHLDDENYETFCRFSSGIFVDFLFFVLFFLFFVIVFLFGFGLLQPGKPLVNLNKNIYFHLLDIFFSTILE